MSMINDALRRASSAAKSPTGTPSSQLSASAMAHLPGSEAGLPLPPSPPGLNAVAPPPIYAGSCGAMTAPPVMRVEPTQKKSSWPIVLIVLLVLCLAGAVAA
jgi:hypothetical protein